MSDFDEICKRIVDSGLLSSSEAQSQLQSWRSEAPDATDGEAFLDYLVGCDLITEFQGDALAAGHTGPFLLGPYEVHQHIAVGRLGGTFRAVHKEFDQPVSLKVFPASDAADAERFARIGRELRIAVELDHPNVVHSFQLGKIGETYYLAMEDLAGETLAARLEREKSLPYKIACKIAQAVGRGLAHCHQNDIVHRDVCPANIWLTPAGTAKIMEFGAARDAYAFLDTVEGGMGITTSESVLGEYDYMAPEQAKDARDADARSDIYALGCVLYHCLTGRPPFVETNPARLVLRHASDTPEPVASLVPDVPSQLDETLSGLLAKDPADRYQEAADAAFALDPFVESEAESPPEIGPPISREYLEWARSQTPAEPDQIPEDAVAVTPELTQFLDWLSVEQARKKRRRP